MTIKVALVGASGNIGPAVLEHLLVAGFEVTVLTRSDSDKTFDSGAQISKVNYESFDSLKDALTGQDVVVSTLNVGAIPRSIHIRLIDAAAAAGVKRFIPSEYGCDTTNALTAKLPVFGDKIAVQDHLKAVSQDSDLSYSLLFTGPFLDSAIKLGFLINTAGPTASLYDGGERAFSATTISGVGKSVVGIINNLDATKNTAVYVEEARLTQKDLLRLSGKNLDTKVVPTADLEKAAYEELSKPSPNPHVFVVQFILRIVFGEGFGSLFDEKKLSNDSFGLKHLSEEEIRGFFTN